MRLLDLTLDRYGPFDGLRLVFDPDASVHIVYGPNEAGKSSALAALGDLFYGAPRREKISFLRPKELRLGATLRGRNGQILQFFRRRGDRNTLLDPSGAALPEDALAPFLGAATRDIFHRAFGLNAASLRAGGDDMLRAEGEIGATLFAAASGLRGLIDLRAGLEAEAEQIFDDRRASHRAFYQALDRFDAARAQERAALVSESALKALGETIESAGEQLSAIEREDSEAQAEALRLERLCKAAPILARLARLRAEAALHDDLASISAEAAQGFVALLAARDAALQQAEQARETREAARREMEAAAPDAALLAEADPIDDLIRASGAYEKAAADLPRREQALREARQMLFARAQTCGLAGVEALRAALPDAATLLRAEKLAARGRELLALRDDPARALAEEKSRLGAADAAPRDDLPEADVLREKLHAFGEIETLDASWRDLSRACAANARALEEKRGRLSPALADAERFARSPSPDAAAIERAARAFEDFSAREAKARLKAQEAGERLVAARARLHNLERQGPIASLTSLREARDRRDRAWLDLRALVADETPAAPERLRDRALLFEALAADADRNADALLANAAQAAAAEGEREAIEAAQVEQDGAAATLDALTLEHGRLDSDWTEAWRACGVAPASPQEMRVWRDKAERLIEDREALRRDQARAQEQGAALERIAPGLETLAAACGLDPLPLDAAALARRIAARIDEIAKAQITAREARARLADAPERIARLEERLARLAEEEKTWRDQWRDALAALCLDSDAAFDEARARVTLWRALPRELLDEEEAANRVDAIGRDMAAFEQRLDALLALCARDISSRPTEPAVAQLRGRLAAARQKAALRARAEQALRAAEEQAALAEQAQTATEADLQAFCARHGQSGAVEQIAARLRERAATEAEIKAESERLALVAEGHDEAALSREAADFDPDSARIRLDMIRRQSKEREDRARDIYAAQRASQGDLARLQQSAGAEAAIVAREAARADIAELSRRWAVLKLSALLVGASLERRRGQRQDPLLARAGVLFAALTEGRYSGLGQNFGEDDLLHLIARRADGEALGLAALSEGARDQLYLALRLAFLEDYAARSESPPFVGDDLFASFDEARAAAGIKALAAAGAAIQPILFTHHAHILRIADQVLGPRAQILRLDSAGG